MLTTVDDCIKQMLTYSLGLHYLGIIKLDAGTSCFRAFRMPRPCLPQTYHHRAQLVPLHPEGIITRTVWALFEKCCFAYVLLGHAILLIPRSECQPRARYSGPSRPKIPETTCMEPYTREKQIEMTWGKKGTDLGTCSIYWLLGSTRPFPPDVSDVEPDH